MKIKITSNPITPHGSFSRGNILSTEKNESFNGQAYSAAFLNHLVDAAGAAERLEYETKVDQDFEQKKKPLSSQSLPPDKASPKKTRGPYKKKPKL